VAPDGTFWVPQSDVQAMLNAGAFFATPGLASVRIGDYSIYEDNTSRDLNILDMHTEVIIPFVVDDEISATPSPGVVVSKTTNYLILTSDNLATFDNGGATGLVILTLPTPSPGLRYSFIVATAQPLEILASGGARISIGLQTGGVGGNATSSFPSSALSLLVPEGIPGVWVAQSMAGSWQLQ
jgi:hypothetical protein